VLHEPQLAAGSQHPAHLGQGHRRILDRAEHQAGHDGVETAVVRRQELGCPVHDRDRHRGLPGRALGQLPQMRLRLDRQHPGHGRRIMGEI
jgi:hypothetical protein